MFGDLGGLPVNETAAKAGTGLGDTYTITGSGSYVLSPNFLIDTYTGHHHDQVLSEPDRTGRESRPRLPRHSRHQRRRIACYGGWPQFNDHQLLAASAMPGSNNSPYIDDNWQVQYTANATWTKGAHTFKFGGDIVRQAMNRARARRRLRQLHVRAAARRRSQGGAVGEPVQQLRGVPARAADRRLAERSFPFEDNHTRSRNWQFSIVREGSVAGRRASSPRRSALRWDYFPMGTRTTRGLERYDLDTNQMLICGVGSVPTDCGYDMGQGNFSPRLGLAYRVDRARGDSRRLRHQLRSVSARVRPRHARQLSLVDQAQPCRRRTRSSPRAGSATASPRSPVPDVSSGVIPVPLNVSARALPDKPKRGYIHSCNLTVQKELPGASPGRPATSGRGSATSTRSWTPTPDR